MTTSCLSRLTCLGAFNSGTLRPHSAYKHQHKARVPGKPYGAPRDLTPQGSRTQSTGPRRRTALSPRERRCLRPRVAEAAAAARSLPPGRDARMLGPPGPSWVSPSVYPLAGSAAGCRTPPGDRGTSRTPSRQAGSVLRGGLSGNLPLTPAAL